MRSCPINHSTVKKGIINKVQELIDRGISIKDINMQFGEEIVKVIPRQIKGDIRVDIKSTNGEDYKNPIYKGGRLVGNISLYNDGSYLNVQQVDIIEERQGIGTEVYIQLGNWARDNGLELRSDIVDVRMNAASKGLWEKFESREMARFDGHRYTFLPLEQEYKIEPSDALIETYIKELTEESPTDLLEDELTEESKKAEVHKAAKEAKIDINTKKFAADSLSITGQAHLDDMNIEQLEKMMDYILELTPSQKEQIKQLKEFVKSEVEGEFLKTDSMLASTASPETIQKVKNAAKKMGIDIQDLATYAKKRGLDTSSISGIANITRGIIAIASGREGTALTEEMVHLATAILEQTNPKMVTEMIAKIDRFAIYKQTLKEYKDNKKYQLSNGKPDIRKIKKEAVDKLIVEVIINQNEGDTTFPELMKEENQSLIRKWWNMIMDVFNGLYKKANISIFEDVATQVIAGDVGGIYEQGKEEIEGEIDEEFYQLSKQQQTIQQKILDTQNSIKKVTEDTAKTEPILLDTEEANNWYEIQNADGGWERIAKRVTDRVKAWYKRKFGNKIFSVQEKAFNELKRKFGVNGHSDFEEIHKRYYNPDGTKRTAPGKRPDKINLPSQEMYNMLEKYYVELIDSFPKGENGEETLIFSEVIIHDPENKEAGTLDFLAIEPSGKAHILDWKFMHITGEDVAWFKQGAFNIQLTTYKNILHNVYGIKEFGKIRAIPISMEFKKEFPKNSNSQLTLKGIAIGSVNPSEIKDVKLIPLSEESESTEYESLDKVLKQLNGLLKQIEKEEVTDEEEREFKIERLNTLRRAIRLAQGANNISGLIDVVEVMRKEGDKILNDYIAIYKDRLATSTDSTNKELSEFSDEMNNYIKFSDVFVNIGREIGHLVYTEEMKEDAHTEEEIEGLKARKRILDKLRAESDKIYSSRETIKKAVLDFADRHIGQRNLVTGLTLPEMVVKGLSSIFRGVSDLPLASLKILYKLTRGAQGRASQDALVEIEELMGIRKKLAERGGDLRKLVQKIYQKDVKGGLVNKLVHKYDEKFFTTVDELAKNEGDINWLRNNIDMAAYEKEALKKLEDAVAKIEKNSYPGNEEQVEEQREKYILQANRLWDINRKDFNGWNNYIIKRHPLDKWQSKEYKEIVNDADLLSLYNFLIKFNKKSNEIGYIDNMVAKTFLPFMRKSMAEELVWDNTLSPMKNFAEMVEINADSAGYGKINEVTGKLENGIPKYYTQDFSKREDGVNDYSNVSEDLFKNMILYIQHVNKYKYLSEVEGQLTLIKTIEEFKGHINTNQVGDIVIKNDKSEVLPGNELNTKMYDDFLKVILYDQKYVLSDSDTPLYIGKVINFVKAGVNKLAGREIWKPSDNPSPTSLIKTMDAANRGFQLKTLGFEILSGAVNMFGGNIQVATQAGNYFKGREFLANELKLSIQGFKNADEKEMFIQLVNTFMPLKDDPSYELFKSAGMSKLTQGSLGDILMVFMRAPEQLLEKSIFLSLLQNTMVENGRIVSIREFVKSKYKGRGASAEAYREAKIKIENEVNELKASRAISITKKLENGKLVIPGLDMNNIDELQRLTNLTRRLSRNATGGLSDADLNKMSMSIWTKSMMVFKNWIPKLVDTRFSEFRKINDDFSVIINEDGISEGDKYDIGRIRLLASVLGKGIIAGAANLYNIIQMNDAGIAEIDKMFIKFSEKYKKETGETLNMSREDFMDLIRTNLRNQVKELTVLLSLFGATLALGFIAPDDDDDTDRASRNAHRYMQRAVNKFVGELSFFYNPLEIQRMLSGSAFPAIGLITDITKFTQHSMLQITGMDFDASTSYEEARKKAMPTKYLFKMLPITKSALTYLSILDSDFAKEYNITIQKESRR